VVATLTVCAALAPFLVSTWVKKEDNVIDDQKRQIRLLTENVEKLEVDLKATRAKLRETEVDGNELRKKLFKFDAHSLFEPNNPYPVGFREVCIGNDIEAVRKAYAAPAEIVERDDSLLVRLKQRTTFYAASYYYEVHSPKKTVTSARYYYDEADVHKVSMAVILAFGATTVSEETTLGLTKFNWSDLSGRKFTLDPATHSCTVE